MNTKHTVVVVHDFIHRGGTQCEIFPWGPKSLVVPPVFKREVLPNAHVKKANNAGQSGTCMNTDVSLQSPWISEGPLTVHADVGLLPTVHPQVSL